MKSVSKKELLRIGKKIKLLILDVDGVLTDGSIILDNKGNELKSFHVRDGHGIKMLIQSGIRVALITGRTSEVVSRRASELGITDLFQKCYNKKIPYGKLAKKYSLDHGQIAYVGDDVVDIPVFRMCGLPITVADADHEVKRAARIITHRAGGKGAVREICDFLLKAQGLWKGILDGYA